MNLTEEQKQVMRDQFNKTKLDILNNTPLSSELYLLLQETLDRAIVQTIIDSGIDIELFISGDYTVLVKNPSATLQQFDDRNNPSITYKTKVVTREQAQLLGPYIVED